MQIDLDTLPDDPAILQQMLRDVVHQHGALHAENDTLRLLIRRLLRQQFGRRSAPPRRNHGALPEHLPRYEVLIDVEWRDCPCCGGALHAIGELRTEQLDIVPAQLRVRVIRRPRYACRACEGAVVVAPAPERPIDGGMATEALIAHVLVSKFCDSLPLYRQAQMLARQGVALDRSTLSSWVGRTCWWLTPLYDLIVGTALSAAKLFAGSDGGARHWAMAMTLIQTAKLNGVDPQAWLTDVLQRIVSGRTKATELGSLLPWNWRPDADLPIAAAA